MKINAWIVPMTKTSKTFHAASSTTQITETDVTGPPSVAKYLNASVSRYSTTMITTSAMASVKLMSALAGSTGETSGNTSSQFANRMKKKMVAARGTTKAAPWSPSTVSDVRLRT